MICKEKSGTRFFDITYINGERIRKSITRDTDRIYRLAGEAYCKELLVRIDRRLEILSQLNRPELSLDYKEILKTLSANFDLLEPERVINPMRYGGARRIALHPVFDESLSPMILRPTLEEMTAASFSAHPDEVKDRLAMAGIRDKYKGYTRNGIYIPSPDEWMVMPYRANSKFPEKLTQNSSFGIKTRSKSELLLGELQFGRKQFFHYDEVFEIDGRLISPDYTGLRAAENTAEVKIIEHRGLSDEDYYRRFSRKRDLYLRAGFREGINLFCTFDGPNGNINMKLVDALIDDIFGL